MADLRNAGFTEPYWGCPGFKRVAEKNTSFDRTLTLVQQEFEGDFLYQVVHQVMRASP